MQNSRRQSEWIGVVHGLVHLVVFWLQIAYGAACAGVHTCRMSLVVDRKFSIFDWDFIEPLAVSCHRCLCSYQINPYALRQDNNVFAGSIHHPVTRLLWFDAFNGRAACNRIHLPMGTLWGRQAGGENKNKHFKNSRSASIMISTALTCERERTRDRPY